MGLFGYIVIWYNHLGRSEDCDDDDDDDEEHHEEVVVVVVVVSLYKHYVVS